MKNAKDYEKKVKKLLGRLKKAKPVEPKPDPIVQMILAILEADASEQLAAEAYERLREEFVDFNELRVAPTKELVETLGKDYPLAREKADLLVTSLGNIFEKGFQINLDFLKDMQKRQQRRALTEVGLTPYVEGVLSLVILDAHAIPVDQSLVDSLKMDELIPPEADTAEVQGFLERIIPQKDALAAHQFFREYVAKHEKQLAEIRQQRRAVQIEANRQADETAREAAEADERQRQAAQAPAPRPAPAPAKKRKKVRTPTPVVEDDEVSDDEDLDAVDEDVDLDDDDLDEEVDDVEADDGDDLDDMDDDAGGDEGDDDGPKPRKPAGRKRPSRKAARSKPPAKASGKGTGKTSAKASRKASAKGAADKSAKPSGKASGKGKTARRAVGRSSTSSPKPRRKR